MITPQTQTTAERLAAIACCPCCANPLRAEQTSLRCLQGHRFDLARQGYVNLLRQQGQPRNADTAPMVAARQRILRGPYTPLRAAVAAFAAQHLSHLAPTAAAPLLLDAGAGPGLYLAAALDACPGARGCALDLSKEAARAAARAHPELVAMVADVTTQIPLHSRCADLILSAFAPRNPEAFARLLRPGARIITAQPLPQHLAELRARWPILGLHPGKEEALHALMAPHFTPIDTQTHAWPLALTRADLTDLLAMGPNAFHPERWQHLVAALSADALVEVSGAVRLCAWQATDAPPRPAPD